MPDSSALWLAADQKANRTLNTAAEGFEVWANPVDFPDGIYLRMICESHRSPPNADTDGALL